MSIIPPNLQLLSTVHTIWCLDDGLGSQLNLSSPPLAAMRPPLVWTCMWLLWGDRLRSALQEVQAQSTAEVHWQKQYYDRKIGAVNLKPGDLVLVKADAWKGKRKIKDRWEEETWEVVCQIVADVPSYKVTNQHRWSWVLHQNWLLLIASEIDIPLYRGSHHTQDRYTSPTPCKTTSIEVEKRECHKRKVVRW